MLDARTLADLDVIDRLGDHAYSAVLATLERGGWIWLNGDRWMLTRKGRRELRRAC